MWRGLKQGAPVQPWSGRGSQGVELVSHAMPSVVQDLHHIETLFASPLPSAFSFSEVVHCLSREAHTERRNCPSLVSFLLTKHIVCLV
jgi:hypothetical protein